MRRGALLLATITLAAPFAAEGHGLWVVKRLGHYVVAMGHSDQEDDYPASKLSSIEARDAAGRPVAVEAGPGPFWSTPIRPEIALLTIVYQGDLSGQTATGEWRIARKGEDPELLAVGRFDKYMTAILDPSADPADAPRTRLQLLPLANPMKARRGDRIEVRLTFEGKPLPGVALSPDYANDADLKGPVTDADGIATVTVAHQGLNVIGATYNQKIDDRDADFIEHIATFSFAIRPLSHQPGWRHPMMPPE